MQQKDTGKRIVIIGGGIVGAFEAYFAFLHARQNNEAIDITIYEKNNLITDTTVCHIVPSLTPDEIMVVMPSGHDLIEKLKISFDQPGGIRINDVEGVNDSVVTQEFINKVKDYKNDEARNKTLFELGKISMALWQDIFDAADPELKEIFIESNFQPCHEFEGNIKKLHAGYRVDLIHDVQDADKIANEILDIYKIAGYSHCAVLTPEEACQIDPYLSDFCDINTNENRWNKNSSAIFRPGGCIDTKYFLPNFFAYLAKLMGQHFHLHMNTQVDGVVYQQHGGNMVIEGLHLSKNNSRTTHPAAETHYVFCPGESIGTLHKLGFQEPASVGFAGASLKLAITLPEILSKKYQALNHCMSIVKEEIHLAWQARTVGNEVLIGIAGTRAFYSDVIPHKNDSFAIAENVWQLNIINEVLPELLSFALDKPTKKQKLVQADLLALENKNIAIRWVGNRSVAFDGYPTLGEVHHMNGSIVSNARCTTHLGSGGVSFSPAAVVTSRSYSYPDTKNPLFNRVLDYSSADR